MSHYWFCFFFSWYNMFILMFFKIWNSILFYSILFYSILFYSILFYSIYHILFHSILFYSCFKLFWFHSRVQFFDVSIRVKTFNGIMCPICTNGLVVLYDTTRTKVEHTVQQMGLNKSHLWQAKLTIFLRKLLSVGHTNSNKCPGKVSNASSTTLYFLLVQCILGIPFHLHIHSNPQHCCKDS